MSDRPENGPMMFGDDWCGVFLRGDCAGPFGMFLNHLVKRAEEDFGPIEAAQLQGLARLLSSCEHSEDGPPKEAQVMRPFEEARAGGVSEVERNDP